MSRIQTTNGRFCLTPSGRVRPCDCEGECCRCGRACDFSNAQFTSFVFGLPDVTYTVFRRVDDSVIAGYAFDWSRAFAGPQTIGVGYSSYRNPACDLPVVRHAGYIGRAFDTIGIFENPPVLPNPPGGLPTEPPSDPGSLPDVPDIGGAVAADAFLVTSIRRNEARRSWAYEVTMIFAENLPGFEAYLILTIDPDPPLVEEACGRLFPGPVAVTGTLKLGVLTFDVPVTASVNDQGNEISLFVGGGGALNYESAAPGLNPQLRFTINQRIEVRLGMSVPGSSCPPSVVAPFGDCCVDAEPTRCVFGVCEGVGGVRASLDWSFDVRDAYQPPSRPDEYLTFNTREVVRLDASPLAENCSIARAGYDRVSGAVSAIYSTFAGYGRRVLASQFANDANNSVAVGINDASGITVSSFMRVLRDEVGCLYSPYFDLSVSMGIDGSIGASLNDNPICYRRRPVLMLDQFGFPVGYFPLNESGLGGRQCGVSYLIARTLPNGVGCAGSAGYSYKEPGYTFRVEGFSLIRCESGTAYGEMNVYERREPGLYPLPPDLAIGGITHFEDLTGFVLNAKIKVSVAGLTTCGVPAAARRAGRGRTAAEIGAPAPPAGCAGCGRTAAEIGALVI